MRILAYYASSGVGVGGVVGTAGVVFINGTVKEESCGYAVPAGPDGQSLHVC